MVLLIFFSDDRKADSTNTADPVAAGKIIANFVTQLK